MKVFCSVCCWLLIPLLSTQQYNLDEDNTLFAGGDIQSQMTDKLDTILEELTRTRDDVRQIKKKVKFIQANKHTKNDPICKDKGRQRFFLGFPSFV